MGGGGDTQIILDMYRQNYNIINHLYIDLGLEVYQM